MVRDRSTQGGSSWISDQGLGMLAPELRSTHHSPLLVGAQAQGWPSSPWDNRFSSDSLGPEPPHL